MNWTITTIIGTLRCIGKIHVVSALHIDLVSFKEKWKKKKFSPEKRIWTDYPIWTHTYTHTLTTDDQKPCCLSPGVLKSFKKNLIYYNTYKNTNITGRINSKRELTIICIDSHTKLFYSEQRPISHFLNNFRNIFVTSTKINAMSIKRVALLYGS